MIRQNIEGKYDVRINVDDDGADDAVLGSILLALREVGLGLKAQKVRIEVLVIDRAEKPSSN